MAIYWSVKNVVSYCLHFVVHLKLRNYFSLCFFLVHYCQGDDELIFWLFTETAPEQVIWNDQHDNVAATGGVLSNPLHQRSLHQQSLINAPIMNLFISKRYLIELSQATLRYRYDCFRLILWIQYLALIKKKRCFAQLDYYLPSFILVGWATSTMDIVAPQGVGFSVNIGCRVFFFIPLLLLFLPNLTCTVSLQLGYMLMCWCECTKQQKSNSKYKNEWRHIRRCCARVLFFCFQCDGIIYLKIGGKVTIFGRSREPIHNNFFGTKWATTHLKGIRKLIFEFKFSLHPYSNPCQ